MAQTSSGLTEAGDRLLVPPGRHAPDLDVDGAYGPATYVPNPNINYAVPQ